MRPTGWWRRIRFLWWPAVLILMLPADEAAAVERRALEAAIVFNFLQFVEWPAEAAQADGAPLALCVRSDSPLLPALRQLEGRPVRRMTLRVLELDAAPRECRAAYLDSAQAERELRAAARGVVLVIGASDYRPADRPDIQLVFSGDRLAFDISQHRAQQSGLAISSRLLRLARTVSE
jgi:hypothetical protein